MSRDQRQGDLLLISTAFRLSEPTDALLDDLARDHAVSRTRIVELGVRWLARTLELSESGELIHRPFVFPPKSHPSPAGMSESYRAGFEAGRKSLLIPRELDRLLEVLL